MYLTTKSGRKVYMNTDEEDAKIQAGIEADPDTYEVTDFSKLKKIGRPVSDKTKDRVNIRLDKEITTYFKATGKGWQTRVNDVLAKYVASH
ncbi:MAG: BrnA antitoxin family protein [gamma proteobacterium symbiont of Taylorina sp.]|nr:BrnA antitoxin family protein [gamma proteobacterium symbiont of Taylorina sp.]